MDGSVLGGSMILVKPGPEVTCCQIEYIRNCRALGPSAIARHLRLRVRNASQSIAYGFILRPPSYDAINPSLHGQPL